jgi:predicted membrane protein
MAFRSIDFWVKVAQIASALLTPVIAVWIFIISSRIQRQQAKTQQQQARTNHLQYRLALMERRMKVFNSTVEFIALVLQQARIETLAPLLKLSWDTREHHLLFGAEIGEYISELYTKGLRLHTIHEMSGQRQIIRPDDVGVSAEVVEWFSGQIRVAEQKFLKYLDFREP